MARPLRLEFPGALYHVTASGNAPQLIFLDDTDRQQFVRLLGHEIQQQHWRYYAYCLMGNHYHLVLAPQLSHNSRIAGGSGLARCVVGPRPLRPLSSVAQVAYRRFVADGATQPSPWRDVTGQIYLGSPKFLNGSTAWCVASLW